MNTTGSSNSLLEKVESMLTLWTIAVLSLFFYTLIPARFGYAQDKAVGEGQEAIRSIRSQNWYDPETDSFRQVSQLSDDDASGRKSQWEPIKITRPNIGNGWSFWSYFGSISNWLFLLLILSLLIGLLLFFSWFSGGVDYVRGRTKKVDLERVVDTHRISELPFAVSSGNQDLLSEAESLMKKGEFNRAIVLLYGFKLLKLDSNRIIALQRGKTNRGYLRELKSAPDLRNLLERTMLAFEEVFFGQHRLTADRFRECWDSIPRFLASIEQLKVGTAESGEAG